MNKRQKLPCEVCGRLVIARYKYNGVKMCKKHHSQAKKYGKVLDSNPRNCHDLNGYRIEGDIVFFELYDHKSNIVSEFMIDKEDLELIKYHKWCYSSSTGYVLTGNNFGKNKRVPLHRFLFFGYDNNDIIIDHINNNKLDCRRSNLRKTNKMRNSQNKSMQTGKRKNACGIVGVYYDKHRNKYAVDIRYNNIALHLSRFKIFSEAVYVRFVAELLLFKEFRHTGNDTAIFKEIANLDIDIKHRLISYVVSRVKRIYQQ